MKSTWSPSTWTDKIPSCVRVLEPWAASSRNLNAASLGIENVTLTEFHGSTLLILNSSPLSTKNITLKNQKPDKQIINFLKSQFCKTKNCLKNCQNLLLQTRDFKRSTMIWNRCGNSGSPRSPSQVTTVSIRSPSLSAAMTVDKPEKKF